MWEGENKQDLKEQAKKELTQYEALLHLVKNNDLGCHVECAGFSLGLCNNSKIIPAIKHTIKEIKKAINGEPNEWE
jgi:hypothetical protein